jgi:hypothetical protein
VAVGLGRLEQRPDSKNQKYVDTIVHDLRRCAAQNLFLVGVAQAVAIKITGHKTRSMYRHYRIIDEKDLREAAARLQAHLDEQPKQRFWSNYGLRDERYGQNTDNLTTGTISMARKLFDFMVEPIGIEPTTS